MKLLHSASQIVDYRGNQIEDLLRDLVAIPSYESERAVADLLEQRLSAQNIPFERRDLGNGRQNVVARVGNGPRSLILHSHMDTVPPTALNVQWDSDPLQLRYDDGRLYGLGAADTKSSLSAMLCVFETLAKYRDELSSEIVLMAVGGEEIGGLGSKAEVANGVNADAIVVGEPTNLSIMIGHKGVVRMDLTVWGKAAHASRPDLGNNAISLMAEAVRAIDEFHATLQNRNSPLYSTPSVCATTINGGQALNVVPESCTVSLDRRIVPEEFDIGVGPEVYETELEKVLSTCRPDGRTLNYSLDLVRYIPPAATHPSEPLVQIAQQAFSSVTGTDEAYRGFEACCDMGHFSSGAGIPGIICGPGSLEQAHQANEFVTRVELHQSLKIYSEIVLRWLQYSRIGRLPE